MKRVFLAIILIAAFSLHAAAPPRGSDRLRELVVFPEIKLTFSCGIHSHGDLWAVDKTVDRSDEISRLRNELKKEPGDIKQLLQLGFLLSDDGQTNDSKLCFQQAVKLCQNKAAVNAQDGLNLADLGEALWQLDEDDKAESAYKKSTMVSSNEWRCWIRAGNFLASHGFDSVFPKELRGELPVPGQRLPQEILDYRPSPDKLVSAETSLTEASRCFDRATALAPLESEVFLQRAGFLSISNFQACFFRHYRDNEKIDLTALTLAFISEQSIASLKKAAEIDPHNCDYITLAPFFAWLSAVTREASKGNTPDSLPDATRLSIQKAMIPLEKLSQSSDNKLAAAALESLGILNLSFGNSQGATAHLRRAVSLDPTREQSWDMLTLSLVKIGSPEEVVAVCESRLKNKDSARNHLLLARAFQHQNKWNKAGEQAQAALKLEPDNVVAQLELVALALKQSADPEFLMVAYKLFASSPEAFNKLPENKEKASRWREWELNVAIHNGLLNTKESNKISRDCLKAVLEHFPDDEDAKKISNALD